MIMFICAVYDSATQAFGRPLFVNATAQAVRSFGDEVRRADQSNDFFKHPDDFSLYCLGRFDDTNGRLESVEPELLVRGKDVKE